MMNINFMDFDIQKVNSDELTEIFNLIREELEYHYIMYNTYPKKVYVYKHYVNFMADDKTVNKNNMIIAIKQ